MWAQAGLTEHSPPGPSSASERLSRARSRYRVLMVGKLRKKQGDAFLSTHAATQPIPSAGSRVKQLPPQHHGPQPGQGTLSTPRRAPTPRPAACPAAPGTSLPQRCPRDGPTPSQRAGLQISAAPAPPPDPRRWRRAAVHSGTCSPAAFPSAAPAERGTRCFGMHRCRSAGTGERARTHLLQRPPPSRFFPFQLSREAMACGLPAQRPPRRCGRPRGPSWVWRSESVRGAEL